MYVCTYVCMHACMYGTICTVSIDYSHTVYHIHIQVNRFVDFLHMIKLIPIVIMRCSFIEIYNEWKDCDTFKLPELTYDSIMYTFQLVKEWAKGRKKFTKKKSLLETRILKSFRTIISNMQNEDKVRSTMFPNVPDRIAGTKSCFKYMATQVESNFENAIASMTSKYFINFVDIYYGLTNLRYSLRNLRDELKIAR